MKKINEQKRKGSENTQPAPGLSNDPCASNGLFHTAIPLQTLSYKAAGNEQIFNQAGSYIVLGTDRPDGHASGYGGMGSNIANSIDLVVGRMASANGGDGAPGQEAGSAQVDNSFFADAARIHISQLTDIDKNFGLAPGNADPNRGRSGIGLKADAIRIIGREGVKIITGEADSVSGYALSGETNSLGGKIVKQAPQIDLIAGNINSSYVTFGGILMPKEDINNLQPAVKGELTRDAFIELSEIIGDLWSATYALSLIQVLFNSALGFSVIEPWRAGVSSSTVSAQLNWVNNSMYHTRINKDNWEFNYCNPGGYKYICSRNVNLT